MFRKILIFLILIFTFSPVFAAWDDYYILPGCIHINSSVGKGKYAPEDIVTLARQRGIKVIIFGDKFITKVEYGIWPLRNILKVSDSGPSLLHYGLGRYLDEIRAIAERNKDLIIIPGAEVNPFYYWTGFPLTRYFVLHDPSKHIFIAGLNKPEEWFGLPVISNPNLGRYDFASVLLAWPLLFILAGIYYIIQKPVKRRVRKIGFVCLLLGLIFSVNNFPFKKSLFDPYSIKNRVLYYQRLIDYVNKKGGSTFWLQPCGVSSGRYKGARYETLPFEGDLFSTYGYSGFSVFYEGEEMVEPLGPWDKLLLEYCLGRRKTPVWAIGDMDYSYEGENRKELGQVQTVFLVKEESDRAVLNALKNGHMYAYYAHKPDNQLRLDKFEVCDPSTGFSATMGEELGSYSAAEIVIDISSPKALKNKLNLKLIRNGIVIKAFQIQDLPFHAVFKDDYFVSAEKCYYRLEAGGIVANPVFVLFKDLK